MNLLWQIFSSQIGVFFFAIMQRTRIILRFAFTGFCLFLPWLFTLAQVPETSGRNSLPSGLVYVSQKVDLRQQLSADETIYSLDGEPVVQLQTTSLTLGLLLNKSGYVVTRLANFSPQDAPPQLMVLSGSISGQFPATFVGMDSVTGLCLLKLDRVPGNIPSVETRTTAAQITLLNQRPVQLFGFHPKQRGASQPGMTQLRPRIYTSVGAVKKASEDFRFNPNNLLYYLSAPTTITPAQDCSIVVEKDGSVLGLVMYDTSGEETHLVYPMSRVQQIADMILEHKRFVVPHAWLGATSGGHDPNAMTSRNRLTEQERGVLIAAVFPDSPADLAGVRPQDMLISISGRPLTTNADLSSTLRLLPACSEVTLKVRRGNEFKLLPTRLAPAPATNAKQQYDWFLNQIEGYERKAQEFPENDPNRDKNQSKANKIRDILTGIYNPAPPEVWLKLMHGIEVIALPPQLAKAFMAPGGVLISTVAPTGKSAQIGLKVGDVIVKVGEDAVEDQSSFMQMLSKIGSTPSELMIIREGKTITIPMNK